MFKVKGRYTPGTGRASTRFEVPAVCVFSWTVPKVKLEDCIIEVLQLDSSSLVPGKTIDFKVEIINKREFTVESQSIYFFAYLLRRQRMQAQMSLRELAAALGMKSKTNLAEYESGRVMPAFDTLSRILAAMGVEVEISLGHKLKAA